jgi:hypothetical protein
MIACIASRSPGAAGVSGGPSNWRSIVMDALASLFERERALLEGTS